MNRQDATEAAGADQMSGSGPRTQSEIRVMWMLRGGSYTIGELAANLILPRREIEEAVEGLRLKGEAIVGGNDGLALTDDPVVLEKYLEARRRRTARIHKGTMALRSTLRRLRERTDLTLWDAA